MIGAGSSGIASAQILNARGIDFDSFEVGSQIGGNWRYLNDNRMSSAYRSLHINTSRRTMAYAAYPMPEQLNETIRTTSRSPTTSMTTSTILAFATGSDSGPR